MSSALPAGSLSSPNGGKAGTRTQIVTIAAVGLMLFSMFFGAGNLIFPPVLGIKSGKNFTPAIIGFLETGVLLPILTVAAVAISGSGVRDLAARAGGFFGLVFAVVVYLSIGALYGVPRAAAIGYELSIESTFDLAGWQWRLAGTTAFFGFCLLLAFCPGKVVDTVGKTLTPVLLALIAALVVVGIRTLSAPPAAASDGFDSSPADHRLLRGLFHDGFHRRAGVRADRHQLL